MDEYEVKNECDDVMNSDSNVLLPLTKYAACQKS